MLGGWADEDQSGVFDRLCEARSFGEEAVSGMHGVALGGFGRLEQGLGIQVALLRRGRPDLDRLIGGTDVRRLGVRLAVNGHGVDPRIVSAADDSQGDLASVGDQQSLHSLLSTTATA